MGAWGPGNFDNDAVSDWLAELDRWSSVDSALNEVLLAPPHAYVDADTCCVALGAAEVVAACMGRPGNAPPKVLSFALDNGSSCNEQTRGLAELCVRKIEANSELQTLFDEGGRNDEWHMQLQDLLRRLTA